MTRCDGRRPDQLRPTTIEVGVLRHAEGSARIAVGGTVVLCAATGQPGRVVPGSPPGQL